MGGGCFLGVGRGSTGGLMSSSCGGRRPGESASLSPSAISSRRRDDAARFPQIGSWRRLQVPLMARYEWHGGAKGARDCREMQGRTGEREGVQKRKKTCRPFLPQLWHARNREAGDKRAPTHRETEACVVFRKTRDREDRLVYPREREREAQRGKRERDKPDVRSGTRKERAQAKKKEKS